MFLADLNPGAAFHEVKRPWNDLKQIHRFVRLTSTKSLRRHCSSKLFLSFCLGNYLPEDLKPASV